jgi:hypothetical protein
MFKCVQKEAAPQFLHDCDTRIKYWEVVEKWCKNFASDHSALIDAFILDSLCPYCTYIFYNYRLHALCILTFAEGRFDRLPKAFSTFLRKVVEFSGRTLKT